MPPHLVNLAVSIIYVAVIVAGGLYLWQYGQSMRRNAAQLSETERLLVQNREQQERFVNILEREDSLLTRAESLMSRLEARFPDDAGGR